VEDVGEGWQSRDFQRIAFVSPESARVGRADKENKQHRCRQENRNDPLAYLMSLGFTFAVGASIQMIAANFVVEKIALHGCE